MLEIIGLIFCMIIACIAVKKIVECMVNLILLARNKKTHNNIRRTGMVYNKKTKKLEADNSQSVPFD